MLTAQGLCPKYCDEFEGALRTCEAEHGVANASRWQCSDVRDDSAEERSLDALLLSEEASRLCLLINRRSWGAAGRGDGGYSRHRWPHLWMAFGLAASSVVAVWLESTDCALWVRRSWLLSKQRRARAVREELLRRPKLRMNKQHLSL